MKKQQWTLGQNKPNQTQSCPERSRGIYQKQNPRRFALPAPASPDASRGGGQKRSSGGTF
jgi:hypothetical protein